MLYRKRPIAKGPISKNFLSGPAHCFESSGVHQRVHLGGSNESGGASGPPHSGFSMTPGKVQARASRALHFFGYNSSLTEPHFSYRPKLG